MLAALYAPFNLTLGPVYLCDYGLIGFAYNSSGGLIVTKYRLNLLCINFWEVCAMLSIKNVFFQMNTLRIIDYFICITEFEI